MGSNPFPLYDSVVPVMEVPDVLHTTNSSGGGKKSSSLFLFHVLRDGLTYLAACPSCIGRSNNDNGNGGFEVHHY
jgi:hypothetical protein